MATDAQGRTLSDDGYYYWDGTAWQPVSGAGATDAGNDDALKQAILKPEDERTDADWELLASALESDKGHLVEIAHDSGTDLAE
jgi:hypothetical protein